jgi:hypothetical protein
MAKLDAHGQQLLDWLYGKLDEAIPGRPDTYVSYLDAHNELRLPLKGKTHGISLQGQGLNSLAEWTKEQGRPGITGLIIDWGEKKPGSGYFDLFERSYDDVEWWHDQIRQSKEYDWSNDISRSLRSRPRASIPQESETPPSPPEGSDVCEPPSWVQVTTYRVVRDTEKSRLLKERHNWICQRCKNTLTLPDGTRYAEVHHIQPLGGNHDGPDTWLNMLCVCPSCHVLLDMATFDIRIGDLRKVDGHTIGQVYIEYHNNTLRARWR